MASSSMGVMIIARYLVALGCRGKQKTDQDQSEPVTAAPALTVSSDALQTLCARTLLLTIVVCSIGMLVSGGHSLQERYVGFLLLPFPIWLSLARPLAQKPCEALLYARLAIFVAICSTFFLWLNPLFCPHPYAFPYREMAADILQLAKPPFAVLGFKREHAANIVIRVPDTAVFAENSDIKKILVVWNENEGPTPNFVPDSARATFSPASPVVTLKRPYAFFSGKDATLRMQVWEKTH